jgi:hypothetical protein
MPRKKPKTASVSLHIDFEIAQLLLAMPNRSEFIRKAIKKQLDYLCPLCAGMGTLLPGLVDHYAEMIGKFGKASG